MSDREFITKSLKETAATIEGMIAGCTAELITATDWIAAAIKKGNTLLLCGNGGSAADCQHISTEFVVRLSAMTPRGALPANALTTNTSTITACANDFGFDMIFSRQVEALGRSGDVLIAISTSGRSPNVVEAAKIAKAKGIKVIAFLGSQKRDLGAISDLCLCIPSDNSQNIQEGHITAGHLLVALVEARLIAAGFGK
ncbi:MAG: SIS domain-containing protein [bacterium]